MMNKDSNIALLFFLWLFFESPMRVFKTWVFFLKFGLDIFSARLLARTFFDPWHRYWYGYPKQLDLALMFQAFFGNIMSRVIGALLRTFFILLALVFDAFVFAVGAVFFLGWVALPFVSVYLFYKGFQLIG